jgi:hypothetical protein
LQADFKDWQFMFTAPLKFFALLDQLDRLHLTLQLELGKSSAPFKEVIVEEAIVRLLEQVSLDKEGLVSVFLRRQENRK